MHGFPWLARVPRACPMAFPWTNGVSVWNQAPAIRSGLPFPAVARPMDRLPFTPSVSGMNGYGNMPLRAPPAMIFISPCRRCLRATWPSRFSGTPPLRHPWWHPKARATTQWTMPVSPCGAWRPRPMALTGKKARSLVIRTPDRGQSSNRLRSIAPRLLGFMPSS